MPKGIYVRTEENTAKSRVIHNDPNLRDKRSLDAKKGWAGMTPEARANRIDSMRVRHQTTEARAIARASHIKTWQESEKYRILHSIRVKEGMADMSQEAKEQMWLGHSLALKDKPLPDSQRLAIKHHHQTPEYKAQNLEMLRQYWSNEKVLAQRSETSKCLWQDSNYVLIQMRARGCKPNKAELKLQDILDEYFPNTWKYTGDGQLIIGGKCPDFANINGKKDLIDLFGQYWHKPEEVIPRKQHFARYGYNCIIIWEHELKDKEALIKKIQAGREEEEA